MARNRKAFPLLLIPTISRVSNITGVGTTFNVFSYDKVRPENQTYFISPTPSSCLTFYATSEMYIVTRKLFKVSNGHFNPQLFIVNLFFEPIQ